MLVAVLAALALLYQVLGAYESGAGSRAQPSGACGHHWPQANDGHSSPVRCVLLQEALPLTAVARLPGAGPRPASVLDPFPGPQLKQLQQFGGEHEEQLLWGTYRPGYYFGAVAGRC